MGRWSLVAVLALCVVAAQAQQLLVGEDALTLTFNAQREGEVVFEDVVRQSDAGWLRLRFRKLSLNGHTLRLTSLEDGAVQHLNGVTAAQWRLTTAYFNGDSVLVEVLASERGAGHVVLALKALDYDARLPGSSSSSNEGAVEEKSVCYSPDTRVLSNDTRQGRYIYDDPNGCCTAWITDAPGNCFLSAGHCTDVGYGLVEFNVPMSKEDGTLVHPGPEDQYIVDQESMQTAYNGITNDWRFFGVFPNSEHGLTPLERYTGLLYRLARSDENPEFGANLEIIGFGENEDFPATERRVQKTASGPFHGRSGDTVDHRVDTSNGNSGSAIFDTTSNFAIGIHTNGGCTPSSGNSHNYGVSIFNTRLQQALANPRGVCAQRRKLTHA